MKTCDQLIKLNVGETIEMLSAMGNIKIRRTPRGIIITDKSFPFTSPRNHFVKTIDIEGLVGNLNCIGIIGELYTYGHHTRFAA